LPVAAPTAARARGWRIRSILRSRSIVIGGVVVLIVVIQALCAPYIAPFSPDQIRTDHSGPRRPPPHALRRMLPADVPEDRSESAGTSSPRSHPTSHGMRSPKIAGFLSARHSEDAARPACRPICFGSSISSVSPVSRCTSSRIIRSVISRSVPETRLKAADQRSSSAAEEFYYTARRQASPMSPLIFMDGLQPVHNPAPNSRIRANIESRSRNRSRACRASCSEAASNSSRICPPGHIRASTPSYLTILWQSAPPTCSATITAIRMPQTRCRTKIRSESSSRD